VLLNGFGFSGYRSFGNKLAKISPLRKVNLIIGQNNVGKSNIVNFLHDQYSFFTSKAQGHRDVRGQQTNAFSEIDRHISNEQIINRIAFPLLYSELDQFVHQRLPNANQEQQRSWARKILTEGFASDENCIWFVYYSSTPNGEFEIDIETENFTRILQAHEWQSLWSQLAGRTGGSLDAHWIPETLRILSYTPESCPKVEVIPAIRKIGSAGSQATDFSGEGIIERLAMIQNPSLTSQNDKEKFIAINKFLQTVLENETATIEIPFGRDMILVHMDNRTLPLESLGTGVHEVLILAAAATLLEKTIVCVEEPELHLHPLLQKKLVNYLSVETNNQYFFTTHSAHLLDAVEAEIFHVTLKNNQSYIEAISSTKQKSNICNDLGYRASDILQANCIIWVEGPSDRLYLNYWIKSKTPNLVEGVHYSIMFYGGRLFSHLTALDRDEETEMLEDFIAVRQLNRNAAIMFDSDKATKNARISSTKRRLKTEFNKGPGFAWITKGREVENYLNMDKVEESVLKVHPSAEKILYKNQWSNLLEYRKKRTGKKITANKVKIAKHYIENNEPDFSVLDLKNMLTKLIDFIMDSNGHHN